KINAFIFFFFLLWTKQILPIVPDNRSFFSHSSYVLPDPLIYQQKRTGKRDIYLDTSKGLVLPLCVKYLPSP
ncbi:MAG: hypothetical protein J3R72DRAFT_454000, partial [Linnemannia gamsii]